MEPDWTTQLRGRRLRWVLLILLADAKRPLPVPQLVAGVQRRGWWLQDRPGKTVSDALRWEIRRGRVQRVARSTYAIGYLAKSTEWWIRQQVRLLEASTSVQPPSDNRSQVPDWLRAVAKTLDEPL